jgi:membrane protease YdiL (CAAX protease family)
VAELVVVLAVTFGLSGAYAVLDLVSALLAPADLGEQTAALNVSRSEHSWLDLAYQALGVLRLLAWALLPLVLLAHSGLGARAVGLVRDRPGRQIAWGLALTAVIGVPGLALYLGAVAAGVNLQVSASGLGETWWRPVVLVLSAAGNGAAEEILVVGYLLIRPWRPAPCCAGRTTSTRGSAAGSGTWRWVWCSRCGGCGPAGCGRSCWRTRCSTWSRSSATRCSPRTCRGCDRPTRRCDRPATAPRPVPLQVARPDWSIRAAHLAELRT